MWWHSLGEADLPVESGWLSAAEAQRMRSMRFTKRRVEWLLGRWTGKNALAAVLGFPADPASLARIEIRSVMGGAAQGAPEVFVDGRRVPHGVSLSDRAGWAVCVVGELTEIGCDLELVEPRSATFVHDFFTPREREVVADPPFESLTRSIGQPDLVKQGERAEGASHRPAPRHAFRRGFPLAGCTGGRVAPASGPGRGRPPFLWLVAPVRRLSGDIGCFRPAAPASPHQ